MLPFVRAHVIHHITERGSPLLAHAGKCISPFPSLACVVATFGVYAAFTIDPTIDATIGSDLHSCLLACPEYVLGAVLVLQ
eukprot:6566926-Alexandrium_andersonii.AAC.1